MTRATVVKRAVLRRVPRLFNEEEAEEEEPIAFKDEERECLVLSYDPLLECSVLVKAVALVGELGRRE